MILFWAFVLAISALLYVVLDGADLGVGIIFVTARDEADRDAMINAIAPIWDGNETWLVVTGVVLWSAFPVVYATLLSAFYLPLIFMLAGLILRGVAFEFRHRTEQWRWLWDWSFTGGSIVATFMQGLTVGALVEGLPFVKGQYAGGILSWFSPFAIFCGIGLCVGYALLGASWLIRKSEGEVQMFAYRLVPPLALGLLAFLVIVFSYALVANFQAMARWLERPYLLAFPAIGALAAIQLWRSVQRRWDMGPFLMVSLIFMAAFGTLAISFWPYMIPFSITVDAAAAPHSTLAFMFWGAGAFVFPLMLIYTAFNLSVFRGKSQTNSDSY